MPDRSDDGLSDLLGEKPAERALGNGEEGSSSSDSVPAEAAGEAPGAPQKTGYLGNGRYGRADGVVERLDIYVSPETARALRVSAATRDDPNGKDVSEIVRTLIEKAGYS